MARNNAPNFSAVGTSHVSVFQTMGTANPETCQDSTTGEMPVGVSQEACKGTPGLPGTDTTIAATVGEQLLVYGLGDTCLLYIGSGGCTSGDYLKPDASGNGITAAAGERYGAQALQTVVSGAKCLVVVIRGVLHS